MASTLKKQPGSEKVDKNAQDIALVEAYIHLTKVIAKRIKDAVKSGIVRQNYFEKETKLKQVTFYRRMHKVIPWKPEEIITLLKSLDKIEKLNK